MFIIKKMRIVPILLCFTLILSLSNGEEEISFFEKYYDSIVQIIKGLSDTSEAKCSKVFVDKKEDIIKLVKKIISLLQTQSIDLSTLLPDVMNIDGLIVDCNLLVLAGKIFQFKDDIQFLIETMGNNILKNYKQIFQIVQKMLKTLGIEGKMENVGKILKLILEISVN